MRHNDIEMTILVRGKPITEYPLDDQVFVEGRAGSEYEIDIYNHSSRRIEAVISVDGLSVLDGKPAGAESRGYLVPGGDSIRVPGWTLNTSQVAKFAFAGKQQSYATQMTGDSRNNGVIGLMAYREKYAPPSYRHNLPSIQISTSQAAVDFSDRSRGIAPMSNMSASSEKLSATSYSTSSLSVNNASASVGDTFVQNSLGTAFGQSTDFATRTVSFQRDGVITTMVIGYDEKRGLKARGIEFPRRPKQPPQPQAFPGLVGCAPPPGWVDHFNS